MLRRTHQLFDRDLFAIVGTFVVSWALMSLPYGLVMVFALAALAIIVLRVLARSGGFYLGGVLLGCMFLLALSLLGFYLNAKIVGDFNNGGTWVPDHTLRTGLAYSVENAPMFVAAMFGYDSNTTYGSNNSDTLLITGMLISAVVITTGIPVWKFITQRVVRSRRLRPLL